MNANAPNRLPRSREQIDAFERDLFRLQEIAEEAHFGTIAAQLDVARQALAWVINDPYGDTLTDFVEMAGRKLRQLHEES